MTYHDIVKSVIGVILLVWCLILLTILVVRVTAPDAPRPVSTGYRP